MAYVIASACIDRKDRSCIEVCPADCIHESARMLVIDPDACIDCAACEIACPHHAIAPASALRAAEREFVRINAAWLEGPEAVEALVAHHLSRCLGP